MQFEITREEADRLKRRVWSFEVWIDSYKANAPIAVQLVRYATQDRETLRHKWKIVGSTFAATHSFGDWRYGTYLSRDQADLPDDVRAEAITYVTRRTLVVIPEGHYERQQAERKR